MGKQFQNLEDARSKLLKEEADYSDALNAYFRAIGTPQQLEAGRKLDKEEAEYRAIDEAVATYTQQNCSISAMRLTRFTNTTRRLRWSTSWPPTAHFEQASLKK